MDEETTSLATISISDSSGAEMTMEFEVEEGSDDQEKPPLRVVSVRLPREMVEWLEEEADDLGYSRSHLVRQALETWRASRGPQKVDWTDADERGSGGWGYRADLHFNVPPLEEMDTIATHMVATLRRELAAMGAREIWSDLSGVRPMSLESAAPSWWTDEDGPIEEVRVTVTPEGLHQVDERVGEATNWWYGPRGH